MPVGTNCQALGSNTNGSSRQARKSSPALPGSRRLGADPPCADREFEHQSSLFASCRLLRQLPVVPATGPFPAWQSRCVSVVSLIVLVDTLPAPPQCTRHHHPHQGPAGPGRPPPPRPTAAKCTHQFQRPLEKAREAPGPGRAAIRPHPQRRTPWPCAPMACALPQEAQAQAAQPLDITQSRHRVVYPIRVCSGQAWKDLRWTSGLWGSEPIRDLRDQLLRQLPL